MPAGRPTKYLGQPHCDAVLSTAEQGATVVQMAVACGTCVDTIYEWVKVHPEFSDAVTHARLIADAPMENAVYRAGLDGDSKAFQMWLHNRRPKEWKDTRHIEHAGEVDTVVRIVDDV